MSLFFYRGEQLYAVRKGPFKAHFITRAAYGGGGPETHDPPELYQLEHDPSEKYNIAETHSDIVADLIAQAERHKAAMVPGEPQLDKRIGK